MEELRRQIADLQHQRTTPAAAPTAPPTAPGPGTEAAVRDLAELRRQVAEMQRQRSTPMPSAAPVTAGQPAVPQPRPAPAALPATGDAALDGEEQRRRQAEAQRLRVAAAASNATLPVAPSPRQSVISPEPEPVASTQSTQPPQPPASVGFPRVLGGLRCDITIATNRPSDYTVRLRLDPDAASVTQLVYSQSSRFTYLRYPDDGGTGPVRMARGALRLPTFGYPFSPGGGNSGGGGGGGVGFTTIAISLQPAAAGPAGDVRGSALLDSQEFAGRGSYECRKPRPGEPDALR